MITLTIDGNTIQAQEGQTILEVAREHCIFIPTLCENEAVEPYGGCRLCMVEIVRDGRTRLVASCLYKAAEGIQVKTRSERVDNVRRTVIELLLARCPESIRIQEMALLLGVSETRFEVEDTKNKCILCALCTRVCEEVVGQNAISLINRGAYREVGLPFYDDADACIACGSCAYICPTGAIKMTDSAGERFIQWPNSKHKFDMKACAKCGDFYAPVKQLEYMAKMSGLETEELHLCPNCRP